MRDNYRGDYENDLNRVEAELLEKTIRLRDISASSSNEETERFKGYLEGVITQLTKQKEQLEMICKLES
ncbi:MAG: hypothetical protein ACLPY1_07600 [Terracidiphilus sp.]